MGPTFGLAIVGLRVSGDVANIMDNVKKNNENTLTWLRGIGTKNSFS